MDDEKLRQWLLVAKRDNDEREEREGVFRDDMARLRRVADLLQKWYDQRGMYDIPHWMLIGIEHALNDPVEKK